MKFLVKFFIKGLDSGDSDRDPRPRADGGRTVRDAERRGQRTGKAPGLGKWWGRSGPVTRGPESRQGRWSEEKVGDAATVHVGASPAERPDRQMDEDRI